MFDTLAYKLSVLYKNFYAYASARLHPFGLHNAWIFFILYVGKHADCTPAELAQVAAGGLGLFPAVYHQTGATMGYSEPRKRPGRSYHLKLTGSRARRRSGSAMSCFIDWDELVLGTLTEEEERDTLLTSCCVKSYDTRMTRARV